MLSLRIAQTPSFGFSIGMAHDYASLSDEDVLALSFKDPGAFGALVDRYQKQFLSRASMVVRSRDHAEDVVQEAFIRIYRFGPRFDRKTGNFRSWALTILMNVARTHYQRSARDRTHTAPLEPEHYESLADPSAEGKASDEAHANEIIHSALRVAPPEVAEVLRLAFLEELSHAEIGKRLNISSAAVKTRVHRAKAVLRSVINEKNPV